MARGKRLPLCIAEALADTRTQIGLGRDRLRGRGRVQPPQPLRRGRPFYWHCRVAEERPPEGAVQDEVQVLLQRDAVGGELRKALGYAGGKVADLGQMRI